MSPLETLLECYGRQGLADQVWPHLAWCAEHGFVHLSPGAVVLAKPVRHEWDLERVLRWEECPRKPDGQFELTLSPDTWHILYAAGDLRAILAVAPYALPWVSWQRNGGPLKLYKWTRIHEIAQSTTRPGPEDASQRDRGGGKAAHAVAAGAGAHRGGTDAAA